MDLTGEERLLLIDTCGESAGIALSLGSCVVSAVEIAPGKASAEVVGAVRHLLTEAGLSLAELTAIGVVNGPGSFTGMRTGLAAAKGLCEAARLQLAAVSRLEVLADASELEQGFGVLDAGRGDLYVRRVLRGIEPIEFLCVASEVNAIFGNAPGMAIVAGDTKSAERLGDYGAVLQRLTVNDALAAVLRTGGEDAALVEANYVRLEQDIYARKIVA